MTYFQDNPSPYLTIAETSVPATPTTGLQKIYIDPADHKLKAVNSSGGVTIIEQAIPGFVRIASQTLLAPAAVIDFTDIPQTYSHLKLILQGRSTAGGIIVETDVSMTFNNDSGSNYDAEFVNASGTSSPTSTNILGAAQNAIGMIPSALATAHYAGSLEVTIPNYAGTTFYKTYLSLTGTAYQAVAASMFNRFGHGQWRDTSAINRITLAPSSDEFDTGTMATLYGMI